MNSDTTSYTLLCKDGRRVFYLNKALYCTIDSCYNEFIKEHEILQLITSIYDVTARCGYQCSGKCEEHALKDNNTALHMACMCALEATALLLIQKDIDILPYNKEGFTALQLASQFGLCKVVAAILEHKDSKTTVTMCGSGALQCALRYCEDVNKKNNIVTMLLQAGCTTVNLSPEEHTYIDIVIN